MKAYFNLKADVLKQAVAAMTGRSTLEYSGIDISELAYSGIAISEEDYMGIECPTVFDSPDEHYASAEGEDLHIMGLIGELAMMGEPGLLRVEVR